MKAIPDTFRTDAQTMSRRALGRLYHVSNDTIDRWIKAVGVKRSDTKRPMPEGFAEIAPTMSIKAMRTYFKAGELSLHRWLEEAGIKPSDRRASKGLRPVPDDFAIHGKVMSQAQLFEHYRVSLKVLQRWRAESGIRREVAKPERTPFVSKQRAARVKNLMILKGHPGTAIKHEDMRRRDEFSDAADALRTRFPVYRCDERGRQDERGSLWRVGNVIVTPDELLERAAAKQRRAA